ncbi:MAG: glycosyltransferase family 2 protein [Hyphomicrobiales bacterium]|nr:glycosyltransferase family 2 protein [Hyphomicrobiales bacterium]
MTQPPRAGANPVVSVVIPVHNGAATLSRAVDSALAQDLPAGWNLEVVVVDDGSDDDPLAALAHRDPAVRCLRQDNAGPAAARNRGIAASRGSIVAFLDSDDEWLPGHLRAGMAPMLADPGTSCAFCWAYLRRPDGSQHLRNRRSPSHDREHRLLWPNPMQTTTGTLCRRSALDAVGAFDESLRVREDLDLWIRLGEVGEVAEVRRPLAVTHQSASSYSFGHEFHVQRGDYFRIVEKSLARTPDRYGPLAERIRAEAHRYWGQYALYQGDRAQARACLGRSQAMNPRPTTLALVAMASLPAPLLASLRQVYTWSRRRDL